MSVICYIPMLEGQADEVQRWLDGVRDRYDVVKANRRAARMEEISGTGGRFQCERRSTSRKRSMTASV